MLFGWLLLAPDVFGQGVAEEARVALMDAATVRVLCVADPAAQAGIGSGSGFVVGATGGRSRHVVTNWHVVECTTTGGAVVLLLGLGEANIVEARVVARDEPRDLAVLEADRPLGRPAVRFALVSTVRKLDPVTANGFPGAADDSRGADPTEPSSTPGNVSRIHDRSPDPRVARLIQHTASINPGNSGGPLFDAQGRVIGINTQKSLSAVLTIGADGNPVVDRVTRAEGIGWAVATDDLLPLLQQAGIPVEVSGLRPEVSELRTGASGALWGRDPLVVTALVLLLVLSGAALALAATRRGRAVMREGFTRVGWTIRRAPPPGRSPPPGPALGSGRGPAPNPAPNPTPGSPPRSAPRWPPGTPLLRGVAGPFAGAEWPLTAGPIAIGRDPALANVVVPAEFGLVTRRHAVVVFDAQAQAFTLEDAWSSHGTVLQGRAIPPGEPVVLRPGERFHLATPAVAFEVGFA